MFELFDISPPLDSRLAVFPGDTSLSREILSDLDRGDVVTLSTLRSTVHLGAHVDAPSHYTSTGPGIEQTPLERLLGPCRLVHVGAGTGRLIEPEPLADALDSLGSRRQPLPSRVLVRTGSFPDPRRWTEEFVAISPEAIDWLAAAGVTTVGIDTPSVDPADSKLLPAHAAVARHGMTILEGLRLDDVPAGDYELIALPLRLVGFDGSPVRAVLRSPAA
ncbi:MAG: cyclase family protein [Gemmatimonadota bacterium]|nr:cyclase family protein [Gemmatimonadota bacterium]MDH3427267.1 cyclase family protein [Gemmatimonadota bacterium]